MFLLLTVTLNIHEALDFGGEDRVLEFARAGTRSERRVSGTDAYTHCRPMVFGLRGEEGLVVAVGGQQCRADKARSHAFLFENRILSGVFGLHCVVLGSYLRRGGGGTWRREARGVSPRVVIMILIISTFT